MTLVLGHISFPISRVNYEITPRLAPPVPHLGLDLAVHQARAERSSTLHLCRDQICDRFRDSLRHRGVAKVAVAPHPSRLDPVGHHRRSIFQPELRITFLG